MPKVTAKKNMASKTTSAKKPVAASIKTSSVLDSTNIPQDFITCEKNCYEYSLGNLIASSFSGFIAGIVACSLIWIVVINVFFID